MRDSGHELRESRYRIGDVGYGMSRRWHLISRIAVPASRVASFIVNPMKRLLREPLIHFLLIGAVLFAAYGYMQRGRGGVESSKQIQLTVDDLAQLILIFQAQWRRDPTPDEISRLVESKIQEEVLYREGLAMGLDKDDTIVKRRMAQKLQFLSEDTAAAREPKTAELKSWYGQNSAKFAEPNRVSFRHIYFSPDRRGNRARDDAAKALGQLASEPRDTKRAASSADPFMFQDYYRERAPDQLAKEFGPRFALAVAKLAPGAWQGPIESGYGWHLVFVDTVIPGRVPDFEEIEPDVKTAWLGEQKAQAWEKAYKEMRAKYTVLLPTPPDKESARAPTPAPRKEISTPSGDGSQ
jgi:peptidyl-prolyl cis-trans isomerase C